MSDSSDDGSPNESFFGLIVKPNKRYDTVVKKAFRISKACIEPATMVGDKVTSLYLEYDGDEFIIANLYKGQMSENLDLSFNLNEKISFKADGPGIVHLTGNTIEEDMAPGLMDDFSDEEMESEEEVETPEPKQKKRKNEANKKDAKKIKLDSTATSNGKADDEESSDDDDEDDSSDETGADTTTLSELDSTSNFAEEEDSDESDDDSEEGEEEEGSDDDSEEESEAEEESPAKPAKTNGDVSPSKKAKLEAKAKAETPKKNVEMTPKNKKEGKPDKTPKQESKTPKAEVKTPKAEAKTPKQEGKTPKQDGKTPKQDGKAPKPESKTPKQESKTPKQESKTPKQESKTPKQEGKTPKTPKPENKLLKDQGAATPKSAKKFSVGGVTIEDLRVGTGPDVKKGKTVGMYYAGRLQSNNKQFDACQTGKPFKFRLGAGEVIKGWDTGIMGMKVGGKRRLTIPAPLAYGSKGAPPDIPSNATLVFEIECKFCN